MSLIPVENNISLKRETSSGGIVNTSKAEYLSIKRLKESRKTKEQKMQNQLDEMRAMISVLLEKQNGSN